MPDKEKEGARFPKTMEERRHPKHLYKAARKKVGRRVSKNQWVIVSLITCADFHVI